MVIYQIFTRLFGNRHENPVHNGTIEHNGVGKMNDFTLEVLQQIYGLGVTHVWYTGIIRHATTTNYTAFGIPQQHASVVKGKAGSPYAIVDYYDIDPDLAEDVPHRMKEFGALLERTHEAGLKVIIDFVPNHVARQYHSVAKTKETVDLGEQDNENMHFSVNNNFYYCVGETFQSPTHQPNEQGIVYHEHPAKATGNDCFTAMPSTHDWYETVKLNYGIDYCNAGGRSQHFDPMPDTWHKMVDILLFWAQKGVDGFRCDMAEMVPSAFWQYAIGKVKKHYPALIFIGEVYDKQQYRTFVSSGFDYLYDKVGMYDCLRNVVCAGHWAANITRQWQDTNDILPHMLYFMENHDEQRIASSFFCGNPWQGIPALMVSAWIGTNPVMVYAGEEFGEPGMDNEGFSGVDGRTTIFDYWMVDTLRRGYFAPHDLTQDEQQLAAIHRQILTLSRDNEVMAKGLFFDLMYAQTHGNGFSAFSNYAFLRAWGNKALLIVVNFAKDATQVHVKIPAHAFDCLEMKPVEAEAINLLSGKKQFVAWHADCEITLQVPGYGGSVLEITM